MNLMTNRKTLANQIEGLDIRTDKFKTTRISVSFVLPLNPTDASLASLLAKLLSRSTKAYPTPVDLHRKLLSLYGARLSSEVVKVGDYQLLNISVTTLADRYALQNEPLSTESATLLCQALFDPNLVDGTFPDADFQICRRLLIESIESSINDKRRYAISQMYSHMCADEPFGVEVGGGLETAQSVTAKQVSDFWQNMLQTAPVTIAVVGNESPTPIYEKILESFSNIQRNPVPIKPSFTFKKPTEVKRYEEEMQLAQGKLVMGFRSDVSSTVQDNLAFRVMCDIFGGAPYSKLFTVVREKMSLCYYCGSRIQSQKGFVCVDCGVDTQNIEAAKEGILAQLEAMKQGDFDQSVIDASLLSMADGAAGITDTPSSIESWYLLRLFDKDPLDPDSFIKNLSTITKESIIQSAQSVTLDTVYVLKGQEVQA